MASAHVEPFILWGSFVHSISLLEVEYVLKGLMGINASGIIQFFEKKVDEDKIDEVLKGKGYPWTEIKVHKMEKCDFVVPGLIDTHTHAPQTPNIGYGQQHELLDWLKHVTFPQEKRFENEVYAHRTYKSVVQRYINAGSTTVCYYGTIHLAATKILASICHKKGQRAFVGKCNMDRNGAVDYVEKSASQSINETKELIRFIRQQCSSPTARLPSSTNHSSPESIAFQPPSPPLSATSSHSSHEPHHHHSSSASSISESSVRAFRAVKTSLVQPILTPRFAISCSDALMASLNSLVLQDPTLPIQTHLAENPSEVEFTRSLFPFADSYTHIYEHFGLLQNNTILAHCVHLDEAELSLIKRKGCGISHCPTSNFNLRSGFTRVGEMLDRGIKVGVGTDISGGFGLSILSALRQASIVSKVLAIQERDLPEQLVGTPSTRGRSMTPISGRNASLDGSASLPLSTLQTVHESISTSSLNEFTGSASLIQDTPKASESPLLANSLARRSRNFFSSRHLSIATLFYLATMGGAEVVCLQNRIGNFVVGKEFDALWIQTGQKLNAEDLRPSVGEEEEDEEKILESIPDQFAASWNPAMFVDVDDPLEKVFEKWLFVGDDRNIGTVWVRGRVIGGARPVLPI